MIRTENVSLCLFEDELCVNFEPLTLTRPVDDLRVGILTVKEKWVSGLQPERFHRQTRTALSELYHTGKEFEEEVIWVNSRLFPDEEVLRQIREMGPGEYYSIQNNPGVIRADRETSLNWIDNGMDLSRLKEIESLNDATVINRAWDLLALNSQEILRDLQRINTDTLRRIDISENPGVHIAGEHPVYAGKNIRVEPGAIFITEEGPVYLGDHVTVMANSVIRGTTAVGSGSLVKPGTSIFPATTIGPVCRIGGEIQNCIFHSYSNKYHDGFTGNSMFGQWVNLGAGTNTSNLKNNYNSVKVMDYHTREPFDTGLQFLGTIMGDHSRTAINTSLNTGTICGVSSNLFKSRLHDKLIPSFRWIGDDIDTLYQFEKAIKTMETVMARRDQTLSGPYQALMKSIYNGESKQ